MGNDTEVIKSIEMVHGSKLEGPLFNDSMCLISSGEPDDKANSRLCIDNSPFIHAPILSDENTF